MENAYETFQVKSNFLSGVNKESLKIHVTITPLHKVNNNNNSFCNLSILCLCFKFYHKNYLYPNKFDWHLLKQIYKVAHFSLLNLAKDETYIMTQISLKHKDCVYLFCLKWIGLYLLSGKAEHKLTCSLSGLFSIYSY